MKNIYNFTKLSTKRLLSLKRKKFPSEQYPHFVEDWVYDCECKECREIKDDIKEYEKTYNEIKNELSKRENVK